MANFLFTLDAAGFGAYPGAPQVDLTFRPDEYAFENLSVDSDVFFSFDGVNDHGILRFGQPFGAQGYESVQRQVWFKCPAPGPSGSAIVDVEANTDT